MTQSTPPPLRVVRLPGSHVARPGWFEPDSQYVQEVWLPLVGPAAFIVWRILAELVGGARGGVITSLEEIAESTGLGSAAGNQTGVARCLRRMARFGLAWCQTGDLVVVRCSLPPVAGRFLALLPPTVRERHTQLLAGDAED